MSRLSLKKFIPSAEAIRNNKSLRFLGGFLQDPNLFHMNRRSVSKAFFWGLFIGLLPPIPVHTPAAATAALISRANLPLTIAAAWVGNPLTIPFIMYAFYHLGLFVLQIEPTSGLEFSWAWLRHEFAVVWKPYLAGSLLGAFSCAAFAYFLSNFFWRWNVRRKWHARSKKMAIKNQ